MDSDQADASLKEVFITLGYIKELLPKEANFRFSVINNINRYANMNGIVLEHTQNPSISFSVDGDFIKIFQKIEIQYAYAVKQMKLVTGSGPQYLLSADYVVGNYTQFMEAYNKFFAWEKYSKDFTEILESELERKDD